MQITLTKKLADAMNLKPAPPEEVDPFFSWTANWTNTFEDCNEDMLVLVNNATRFTVLIYGVERDGFEDISNKISTAIRNTINAMNVNRELADDYLSHAGSLTFCANKDRKMTACVNRSGLEAAFTVGRAIYDSDDEMKYNDTLGYRISRHPVNCGGKIEDAYFPADEMIRALSKLTGKPAYRYRAFELIVTLDLEIYKAIRRIIVPAEIKIANLHKVLQHVFSWRNCHLHDFAVFDEKKQKLAARIVMSMDDSDDSSDDVLEGNCKLSDYFPEYKYMLYTYDMGDSWEHEIELVRVIEEHEEQSPYLLEAVGAAPPEDAGGVGGFIEFCKIILDPNHPNYAETKEWAGYWSPELHEWDAKPRLLYF